MKRTLADITGFNRRALRELTFFTACVTTTLFAAGCRMKVRSSNILVFSGSCAYTNYSTNSRPVASGRGFFRFATDSKQWSLEHSGLGNDQSITYDGQALYTLHFDLPKDRDLNHVIDLGDVSATDTLSSSAPSRMPWLAAWSCGLIVPPTGKVLPPWAAWTHASVYEIRIAPGDRAVCASRKFEFLFQETPWQKLRVDPQKKNWIGNDDFAGSDYVEGVFEVTACTNLAGVWVPLHAQVQRVFPRERGGRVREILVMNTTNVQQIAGTIQKPRFIKRTQVNDWRTMTTTNADLGLPMTRPFTYHTSNQWLEASSPKWRMLVQSNALLEPRAAGLKPRQTE
jgi:hypothetical protein